MARFSAKSGRRIQQSNELWIKDDSKHTIGATKCETEAQGFQFGTPKEIQSKSDDGRDGRAASQTSNALCAAAKCNGKNSRKTRGFKHRVAVLRDAVRELREQTERTNKSTGDDYLCGMGPGDAVGVER